jgi:hypothetical protein
VRDTIAAHPALTFVPKESQTIGGFGRNDRFEYKQRFAGTGDIRNRIFVEAGTASGKEPTDRIRLQSYVGQYLPINARLRAALAFLDLGPKLREEADLASRIAALEQQNG